MANWSACGWVKFVGALQAGGVFSLANDGNGRYLTITNAVPAASVEMRMGDSQTGLSSWASQPPADTWIFLAMAAGASGATVNAWWSAEGSATWNNVNRANGIEGSVANDTIYLGRTASGEATGPDAHYEHWRFFNSTKVQADFETLKGENTPSGSPLLYWSLDNNTDTGDDSGNSRTATFNGTLTTETGPTIVAATREQEGFRWGVDDGNEASHTFEAAQDTNITIADTQSRLLRVLVDTDLDTASVAYTLRFQKNGAGGYTAVPVGASSATTPVIETGDATQSGNNTASGSWAVNHPAASAGDLLIFCISWDDSTATTDVAEPAGPNSEVLTEVNATPATDSGTTVRCKVWYTIATGAWGASTRTFTPTASEQWTAAVIKVPAGEFDAVTPIGASDTEGVTGTGANVQHGAFSAGGSDGSGKLCVWTATDTNPQTVAGGFTQIANTDRGAVAGGFFTRDTVVSNSESFSATTVSTQTAAGWSTVAFVVRAPVVNNEVYIATSGNIAGGGEATTARLTAPAGKTTSDFTTGRRWDDENGTDSIDIAADFYTELEWLVALSATPAASDYFEFRVYAGSSAFDTYTVTPRWTIPGGASTLAAGTWAMMGCGI